MQRRILAYIFFGLGFLTVTYFRNYSGYLIHYPFVFWLTGLVMFWCGFLFLRYTPSKKQLEAQRKLQLLINDVKENGEKIRVNFSLCEIKGHSYTEEQNKYGHESELLTFGIEREIQTLNALGDDRRNVKQVQVNQSVIIFSYNNPQTGKIEKFASRIVPKDKISLSIYLDDKKQTTLFVDKKDRTKYYFDLAFLND